MTTEIALVLLFTLHLVAFSALSWRRRTLRFMPAIVTFTLLIALNLLKALAIGNETLYSTLSALAWLALGLSVVGWFQRWRARSA